MTVLNINGQRVTVGDEFMNLSPEQQEATVNEIASSFGGQEAFTENVDPWVQNAANQQEAMQGTGTFSDMTGSVLGVGLPWGDEILGTLSTPIQAVTDLVGGEGLDLGRSFDRSVGLQRELQKRRSERSPIASTVGGVAGGSLLGMGRAATGATGAVAPTGLSAITAAIAPKTLGGRIALGAGEGAAMGALYGSGEGEGSLTERAPNAAWGAGLGGLIGGAIPAIASGIGAAYRNIANRATTNEAASAAGVSPDVARILANVTEADQSLGATGMGNMSRAGQEAMLADAGENARGMLDTAIQSSGKGGALARGRISERVGRDTVRLTEALDNTLGTPQGTFTAKQASRDAARPLVNDAYEVAMSKPIDYASDAGMQVEDIIKRIPDRIKSSAIKTANERFVYEGKPNLQILADELADGSFALREMPNVAQADAIKKSLDKIVRDGTDAVTGKLSADAQFANQMARDLRNAVKEAVPEYATALNTAADPLSYQSAVDVGANFRNMPRDQFDDTVKHMSDAEKKGAMVGVRGDIDEVIARVRRTVMNGDTDSREAYKAISDLSSRSIKDKITSLVGEEQAGKLFNELDRIAKSFELEGRTANNSLTFARTETKKGVEDMSAPGVVGTAARGEGINAGKRIIQALTGMTDEARLAQNDATFMEIADILTRPSNDAIKTMQAIQPLPSNLKLNEMKANDIAKLLMLGRSAAYPATGIFAGKN